MFSVIIKVICFAILIEKGICNDIEGRVVNGIAASRFIPYQASIRVTIRDQVRFGQGHTCGGVLISRKTVTTAAHCLFDGTRLRNAFDLRVVLGSLNRGIFTEETVTRTAEKIIVHPAYRRGESFANDIGLVILRSTVAFSNIIHSIPIIDHAVGDFTNCVISGWGATSWRGSMPSELMKGNVSIVPRDFCNSTQSYFNTFVDGMVCANGYSDDGIIDVCQGDSGGPLTCDNTLVGLASFGVECGSSMNHPGVFADVFYFKEWIHENWSAGHKIDGCTSIFLLGLIVSVIINLQYFAIR